MAMFWASRQVRTDKAAVLIRGMTISESSWFEDLPEKPIHEKRFQKPVPDVIPAFFRLSSLLLRALPQRALCDGFFQTITRETGWFMPCISLPSAADHHP